MHASVSALLVSILTAPPGQTAPTTIDLLRQPGVKLVSERAKGGVQASAAGLFDDDDQTEFAFGWPNGGAEIVIDLGRPCRIHAVEVVNGSKDTARFLHVLATSGDGKAFTPRLGRAVNLAMQPLAVDRFDVGSHVARFVRIGFLTGRSTERVCVHALHVLGEPVKGLECHCYSPFSIVDSKLPERVRFLAETVGITDVWLDSVATAQTCDRSYYGFDAFVKSGARDALRKAGVRYWLMSTDFCRMVMARRSVLADDLVWATTAKHIRKIYARAKELGFRGVVWDHEDYWTQGKAWRIREEWGDGKLYWQRGHQIGTVIRKTWNCPVICLPEIRIFGNFEYVGGKQYPLDYDQGQYWYLKGMAKAGVRIWMGLEKTYGAGQGELGPKTYQKWNGGRKSDWYIRLTRKSDPYVERVLPGFFPFNVRTQEVNYLPKYLDEQMRTAAIETDAVWWYVEGPLTPNSLPTEALKKAGIKPDDFFAVGRRHSNGASKGQ